MSPELDDKLNLSVNKRVVSIAGCYPLTVAGGASGLFGTAEQRTSIESPRDAGADGGDNPFLEEQEEWPKQRQERNTFHARTPRRHARSPSLYVHVASPKTKLVERAAEEGARTVAYAFGI